MNPDHKPVDLSFRQREGSLVFDRILRRDDKEGFRQRVSRTF